MNAEARKGRSDGVFEIRRAALILPDPVLRKEVVEGFASRLELIECTGPAGYSRPEAVLEQRPDVCVIDAEFNTRAAVTLMRDMKSAQTPTIAVSRTSDSELILATMRAGADEFLSPPFAERTVTEALQRLAERYQVAGAKNTPGKIWVTMPAKPNYGSTTIACNLAVRLAKTQTKGVALVDMDTLMGSVAFLLGLRSAFSIIDAVSDVAHLDIELWKKLILKHGNVDILPGPDAPHRDNFDPESIPRLFGFLRSNYGLSIIDSPGPVSPWQLRLATEADELLLITTNELAAIHSSKRALQHLEAAGVQRSKLRLIVNRYLKENGLSRDAIEKGLQIPVSHILPNDYEAVQRAIAEGRTVGGGSRLSTSLDELCASCTGLVQARKSWFSEFPPFFRKTNLQTP